MVAVAAGVALAASAQFSDDFDRSDGGLGGSWLGNNLGSVGIRGQRMGHFDDFVDFVKLPLSRPYWHYSQSVDARSAPGPGHQQVLMRFGDGGTTSMQAGIVGSYSFYYFSSAVLEMKGNVGQWNEGFSQDLSPREFNGGRLFAYFTDGGSVLHLWVDMNFDGVPEYRLEAAGVRPVSGGMGSGIGLSLRGSVWVDNYRTETTLVPPMPVTGPDPIPFGNNSTTTVQQVFSSQLWSGPISIQEVRFAPQVAGTATGTMSINFGYTSRVPGVAAPDGLSAPTGTGGIPNASGPMIPYVASAPYSFSWTSVRDDASPIVFNSPGVVYFPNLGNMLMEVNTVVPASAQDVTIGKVLGGSLGSYAVKSTRFGTYAAPTSSMRAEIIGVPVSPTTLPTYPHVSNHTIPFGTGTTLTHQVHNAATLYYLGGGARHRIAIYGLRFAPTGNEPYAGNVAISMGYTHRVPNAAEPAGLSLPQAGGKPNADGPLQQFCNKAISGKFVNARYDNYQFEIRGGPFVYDPAAGNLLIETNAVMSDGASVSRALSSLEASRSYISTGTGGTGATHATRSQFITTPVFDQQMPNLNPQSMDIVPFGRGKHVTHQIVSHLNFGPAPVYIDEIAFAPETPGEFVASNVTVRLGYTSREAGLPAEEGGLETPVDQGVPNASVMPMSTFFSGPVARTFSLEPSPSNYQLAFRGSRPFVYDPSKGSLLIEVSSEVSPEAPDIRVYGMQGSSLASCTFSSDRAASPTDASLSQRIQLSWFSDLAPCSLDYTGDHVADTADFFAFFGCFEAGDRCAERDGIPGIDLNDFFAFLNAWEIGC